MDNYNSDNLLVDKDDNIITDEDRLKLKEYIRGIVYKAIDRDNNEILTDDIYRSIEDDDSFKVMKGVLSRLIDTAGTKNELNGYFSKNDPEYPIYRYMINLAFYDLEHKDDPIQEWEPIEDKAKVTIKKENGDKKIEGVTILVEEAFFKYEKFKDLTNGNSQ